MDCGVWFGVFAGKPRSYESGVVACSRCRAREAAIACAAGAVCNAPSVGVWRWIAVFGLAFSRAGVPQVLQKTDRGLQAMDIGPAGRALA
jgi:hypothetical protein